MSKIKINPSKMLLTIAIFILIFQPPFFSVSFVYVSGFVLFIYYFEKYRRSFTNDIIKNSKIGEFYKSIFYMLIYLALISIINIIIEPYNLVLNRMRCINQLVVLTGFGLLFSWYVIYKAKKHNLGFEDIINCVCWAGAIQGILAILAYIFPSVRTVFMRHQEGIVSSWFDYSVRGYGFSGIMLDLFGYGMGLIAGIALLDRKIGIIKRFLIIALCMISVILNARTGFVVFGIAIVVYFLYPKKKSYRFAWIALGVLIIAGSLVIVVPRIITWLSNSDNKTLWWVGWGLRELYKLVFMQDSLGTSILLSHDSGLPDNFLTLLLGSGHNVYNVYEVLGVHSDNGYVNLIWEFGILGGIAVLGIFAKLFLSLYKKADYEIKPIVVFIAASYFVVMIKGVLIGYNPGTIVSYIIVFSLYYFINTNRRSANDKAHITNV